MRKESVQFLGCTTAAQIVYLAELTLLYDSAILQCWSSKDTYTCDQIQEGQGGLLKRKHSKKLVCELLLVSCAVQLLCIVELGISKLLGLGSRVRVRVRFRVRLGLGSEQQVRMKLRLQAG